MSSTPPSGGRLFVEPLEARTAPAGLVGLANNTASATDPNYVTYTSPASTGHLNFVPASHYGVNAPGVYALKLGGPSGNLAGDELVIFNAVDGFNPSKPFIQATAGNVVAFFQDLNHDGQVQSNELVGIALGKKSGVNVNGNVNGDIATNLANDGTLTLNGVGNSNFAVNGLNVVGNVTGDVLSGGDMNNVHIGGTVHNILAGSAATGTSYSFAGTVGGTTGTIGTVNVAGGKVGASVNGLTLLSFTPGGRVQAGNGGFGAVGGSVTGVTLQSDTDTFSILGGVGGTGNATVRGGVGGAVNSVLINGVANSVANHNILIEGGKGGDNSAGKAGVGGTVSGVATSFQSFNVSTNTGVQSADLLAQNITVRGGDGGDGYRAGAGGGVTISSLFGSIPSDGTATPEIQVVGGNGGAVTTGGIKGGNGGSINQVVAENVDTLAEANASAILVEGGNATYAKGGGSVTAVSTLGKNITLDAGNGSYGNVNGGAGGNLASINILGISNLLTSTLTLNAGQGGDGTTGNGGAGGTINTVAMADADLTALTINSGSHGKGGNGGGGFGGVGGSVNTLTLTDTNPSGFSTTPAAATIVAGAGGNGQQGGGTGGGVTSLNFVGSGFSYAVTAGAGGSSASGAGGAGGSLTTVGVSNVPDITNVTGPLAGLTGNTAAGAGGAGATGGGAGGELNSVTLLAGDTITLQAGNGGTGGGGAAGAGGQVIGSGANSLVGSISLTAGNAGLSGAAPGVGGDINGFGSSAGSTPAGSAGHNISYRAGDGHAGGAGGNILNSATSTNVLNSLPNSGNVTIQAGNGSAANGVAGAGGNVNVFDGSVGLNGLTSITAGNGGGATGDTKVGAGGAVSQIHLTGASNLAGVATAQRITVDAGNAGVSSTAKNGASGGAVNNVVIYNLDAGTVLHHIAAGDGSSGTKHGGAGGLIDTVNVGVPGDAVADIGIRSGVAFGYAANQAGGLFAGVGGTGSQTLTAVNGSVSNITALAISGIQAGKASRPQLVASVDHVTLEGLVTLLGNADGSFANFGTANLVGSNLNPNAAQASTYKAGDGFIASQTLPTNTNFNDEDILTLDGNGNREFSDFRQPNPTPVTVIPVPTNLA